MHILAGQFKGRILKTPKGDKTRPTSSKLRGSVFDILRDRIEGSHFLDLFAGSGAMGIEALSRGAQHAIFIDQEPKAISCIEENLKMLGALHLAEVYRADASYAVKRLIKKEVTFDLIYVDPPFALEINAFLNSISQLLKKEGLLVLEQGKRGKIDAIPGLKELEVRTFGDVKLFFFERGSEDYHPFLR